MGSRIGLALVAVFLLGDDPTKERRPVELDLSPLPVSKTGRYKLHIRGEAGKEVYAEVFDIAAETEHGNIRDLITVSVESVGWRVKAVGKSKLVIYGPADGPVDKLDVRVTGLHRGYTPTVRRLSGDR